MLTTMLNSCNCTPALAGEIPYTQAVKSVMGEAGGCDYQDKLAIACAIRNRKTLTRVYGLNSKTVYPAEIWQECARAWAESETNDITQGADHWLSRWDLKHCRPSLISWRFKMVKTLATGNFTFYRAKGPRNA